MKVHVNAFIMSHIIGLPPVTVTLQDEKGSVDNVADAATCPSCGGVMMWGGLGCLDMGPPLT